MKNILTKLLLLAIWSTLGYSLLQAGPPYYINNNTVIRGELQVVNKGDIVSVGDSIAIDTVIHTVALGQDIDIHNNDGKAAVVVGRELNIRNKLSKVMAFGDSIIVTGGTIAGGLLIGHRLTHTNSIGVSIGEDITQKELGGGVAIGTDITFQDLIGGLAIGNDITVMGNGSTANRSALCFGTNMTIRNPKGVLAFNMTNTVGDELDNTKFDTTITGHVVINANGYTFLTNSDNGTVIGTTMVQNDNAWSSLSDSTKKYGRFNPDYSYFYNALNTLEVPIWKFKADSCNTRTHIGLMAQDFHDFYAKRLGLDMGANTVINTADADGVLFATMKGMQMEIEKLKQEVENKDLLLFSLYSKLTEMEVRLSTIENNKIEFFTPGTYLTPGFNIVPCQSTK